MLQSNREENHFSGFQRDGQSEADTKKVLAGWLEAEECAAKAMGATVLGVLWFYTFQGNKSPI